MDFCTKGLRFKSPMGNWILFKLSFINFLWLSCCNNMHVRACLEVKKLFTCTTQLSIKFKLLINDKIAQTNRNFRFRSPKHETYPAQKC